MEGRHIYEFGDFRLDTIQRLLERKDGGTIVLPSRAFDALCFLVAHAGTTVPRSQLMDAVWPQTVVEENNLSQCIAAIRRALGERAGDHKYIVTIPGRGLRFVAPVTTISAADPAATQPNPQPPPSASDTRTLPRRTPRVSKRGWLAVAAGAGILLLGLAILQQSSSPPAASPTRHMLAVLPFKPINPGDGNPSLQYGMAHTLITRLQAVDALDVQPLSSVRRFGGIDQDPLAAARELSVQSVLDGTIQRDGDRLRVTAQLFDTSEGSQLWSAQFNEDFVDIFAVQDTIAERVALALSPQITQRAQQNLSRRYTDDAEAYQLYVNGWFQRSRTREEDFRGSIEFFEKAIARDPNYPHPYVGLADSYAMLGVFGALAPDEAFPPALRAVNKALALEPDLGEAHTSLGHIKLQYERDLAGAERSYLRAIELTPNYALVHLWYALLEAQSGRVENALTRLRHAQQLEPLFLGTSANIGMLFYFSRRYDEAIEQLQGVLKADPTMDHARSLLGRAHLRMGNHAAAIEEFQRRTTLSVGSYADLGSAHALAGRREDAIQELDRLLALSKERYVPAYDIATIYAALGDADEALRWLERAAVEKGHMLGFLWTDPAFDSLRAEPRFKAFTKSNSAGGIAAR